MRSFLSDLFFVEFTLRLALDLAVLDCRLAIHVTPGIGNSFPLEHPEL
jgi:hypothetical protein